MSKRNMILAFILGLLVGLCGIVYADTTMVRIEGHNAGSADGTLSYGDISLVGSDGVLVTPFIETIDNWEAYISADMTYINANVVPTGVVLTVTAGDGLTDSGTATDPILDVNTGDGLTTAADVLKVQVSDFVGGGIGSFENNLLIQTDGVDDTMIDWGTGASQASSTDVPNDTTNFDGNLSGADTTVLLALETLDELPTGGGLKTFYLETTASDVGGYKLMADTYANDSARTSSASIVADGTAIEEWATLLGKPNQTVLLGGPYHFHFYAEQTAGTKTSTVYYELYKRASGGGETLLGTSDETGDLTGSSAEYNVHVIITEQVILPTDRLVIKVLGNEGSAGTDPTVQINYQSTTLTRFEYAAPGNTVTPTTLDIAYDNGDTFDYSGALGAVNYLFPSGGTPDVFDGRNVQAQFIRSIDNTDTNTLSQWYFLINGATAGTQNYGVMSSSTDNGSTINEDHTFQIGGPSIHRLGTELGDATNAGTLKIYDVDGDAVTVDTPDLVTSYTLTLPPDAGANLEVLKTDGSGNTDWVAQTVNTISTTANSGGGLQRLYSEATSGALSGATGTIQVNIPTGARVLGCQLRVDTTVAGPITWTADYSGGLSQPIETAGTLTKNDKFNTMFDVNLATDIATSEVDIALAVAGPDFTAGVIRAIVYYEDFIAMDDNP